MSTFSFVISLSAILLLHFAESSVECGLGPDVCPTSAKYRSIDGSCNNLKNPKWGSSSSEYGRLLKAKYSDGNGSLATSVTGEPLPSARKLSVMLYPSKSVTNTHLSLNAMAYGQFVTHDLSFTTLSIAFPSCCTKTFQFLSEIPDKCAPIQVPDDDPFYSQFGVKCMSMPRTDTNRDNNCSLDNNQVEQLNQITSYMDLHMIYGFNNETYSYARSFKNGLLNATHRHDQIWLTDSRNISRDCSTATNPPVCYEGVDPRVDQNTHLTLLHIIYLREHNRIAAELGKVNPQWDDEKIYQETRNILISIHQHIAYSEWLPVIVGKDNLLERKILYESTGFIDDYDENQKIVAFNEFSHGANRHFHSMIAQKLMLSPDGRNFSGYQNISKWWNSPAILEKENNFDDLARGLQCQYSMGNDKFHEIQTTTLLFVNGAPFGNDLKSIDIQRSRDHGLPSYNDMRKYCGLPKANDFSDLNDTLSNADIQKLQDLYADVNDVDLIVGGLMETFVSGAITGPTFFCILMKQYYLTRVADRFWYQNGRSGLTPEQLGEIQKISISKLMCNNGKNITAMQPQGFYPVSESNDLVPCEDLPDVNLSLWKEDQVQVCNIC